MYTEVGQQVARFSMRDDRTMFLFTFADPRPDCGDVTAQKAVLRHRFVRAGGNVQRSWVRSIALKSCTSTALAKSGSTAGRAGGWRWSVMLHIAFPCWPVRDRLSRWLGRTFLRVNCDERTETTAWRLRDTKRLLDRSFAQNNKWRCVLPALSRRNPALRCGCAIVSST